MEEGEDRKEEEHEGEEEEATITTLRPQACACLGFTHSVGTAGEKEGDCMLSLLPVAVLCWAEERRKEEEAEEVELVEEEKEEEGRK